MMRRAAKVDANQREIVAALRAVGATVQPLHSVGQGCPDLLAGYRNVNLLLEVKDGAKPPSARKLTRDQSDWHAGWKGQACIVESVDDVLRIVAKIGSKP